MSKRIPILLTVLALLLPMLFACGGAPTVTDTTKVESQTTPPLQTETEPTPAEPRWSELLDNGRPLYTIVRPDICTLTETSAAITVSDALREAVGKSFTTSTDLVKWGDIPDKYEIVIGNTNRKETAAVMAELSGANPYAVKQVEKRIVIVGINAKYLAQAVTQFLLEYTGQSVVIDYLSDETVGTAKPVMPATPTVATTPAITTGDQTGHPEISAKEVDVEMLLTTKADYDYASEYKIRYNGTPCTVTIPTQTQAVLIKSAYDTLYNVVADVNVRDFGAKGDGKTNDTAAFKAAIAAVETMGSGTVYAPPGYYCLTESLSLPALCTLAGDLKPGTAEGTVLCIYGGKGTTDRAQAAVICGPHASVQNIAFWYPEQTIVGGQAIPYPAAINQNYINGLTVRNVTFVNAYRGIDAVQSGAVLALEYLRDIYGTCLEIGYCNDYNLDIGKLENFNLSPSYWLQSGLPGTPNEELLRTYMIRNSVGTHMGQADFFYFSDIHIEGYFKGMYFSSSIAQSSNAVANGQILNPVLLDCYYPIYVADASWFKVTGGELRAAGNEGAAAVYYEQGAASNSGEHQPASLYFANTKISSAGSTAIINNATAPKTLFYDCSITSAIGSAVLASSPTCYDFVNTTVESGNGRTYTVYTDDTLESVEDVNIQDYVKVTKPASDKFIDLTQAPYNARSGEEISAILQQAIDDLKATGGMVYLPAGVYYVNNHIDLWAGVELRGSTVTAHVDLFLTPVKAGESWTEGGTNPYRETGTVIYTNFGKNDPEGKEFIAMYDGAGIIGLSIEYYEQDSRAITPYSFTIRGFGKDIYLIDIGMSTSDNGIDFASAKCDNHYVEFLWSVGLNVGIQVGAGSKNGIIRDCHYTVNCWQTGRYRDSNYWNNVETAAGSKGRTFVIGESSGEILFNNFSINQLKGVSLLDGAHDVLSVGTAVDYSDVDVYIDGDVTATVINGQFVMGRSERELALHRTTVYTTEAFSGKVILINCAHWGRSHYTYNHNGTGEIFSALSHTDSNKDYVAFARVARGKGTFVCALSTRSSLQFVGSADTKALKIVNGISSYGTSVDKQIPESALTYIKKK